VTDGEFSLHVHAALSRAPLALNRPPTITTQPQGRTVIAGANVAFSVVATGTAPLRYQWQFNGQDVRNATNATLALVNVQTANAGIYSARVSNAFGSVTSTDARLTVNEPTAPPIITQQPQAQTATAGAIVTFSVTATGVAPLRYQWRFNASDLTGRTNATLTLTNVQAANAGLYAVRVSNAGGSTLSAEARLGVNAASVPPTITQQPQAQSIAQGANATFTVTATGTPPFRFQWRFRSLDLIGATNALLVLTNIQPAQAGNYTVEVSNAGGRVTSAAALLSLIQPPVITVQPQNQTVTAGTNVTFTVTATGVAPLRYQWRLNASDLPGRTNSTLMLTGVQAANAGLYTVRVSNAGGSTLSAEARLGVNAASVPPTIT
ncbi:MAG: immunoglobulin I-set domain-containing protein, partial [Gammaproteobacteria bacterium]